MMIANNHAKFTEVQSKVDKKHHHAFTSQHLYCTFDIDCANYQVFDVEQRVLRDYRMGLKALILAYQKAVMNEADPGTTLAELN